MSATNWEEIINFMTKNGYFESRFKNEAKQIRDLIEILKENKLVSQTKINLSLISLIFELPQEQRTLRVVPLGNQSYRIEFHHDSTSDEIHLSSALEVVKFIEETFI